MAVVTNISYGFGTKTIHVPYLFNCGISAQCIAYLIVMNIGWGWVLARKLRMKIENWERDGLNFLPQ